MFRINQILALCSSFFFIWGFSLAGGGGGGFTYSSGNGGAGGGRQGGSVANGGIGGSLTSGGYTVNYPYDPNYNGSAVRVVRAFIVAVQCNLMYGRWIGVFVRWYACIYILMINWWP